MFSSRTGRFQRRHISPDRSSTVSRAARWEPFSWSWEPTWKWKPRKSTHWEERARSTRGQRISGSMGMPNLESFFPVEI